jgi:hypothetical protein
LGETSATTSPVSSWSPSPRSPWITHSTDSSHLKWWNHSAWISIARLPFDRTMTLSLWEIVNRLEMPRVFLEPLRPWTQAPLPPSFCSS